jgi:hypothetical protein
MCYLLVFIAGEGRPSAGSEQALRSTLLVEHSPGQLGHMTLQE